MRRALCLALCCSFAARAQEAQPAPSEPALQQLEQRLAREREEVEALRAKETDLLGQMAALERLIEIEARALKAATTRLKLGTRRLEAGEARFDKAESDLNERTRLLGPRLTARYRMGREGWLRFLLGARSIGDIFRRKRLLTALVEHDIDALASLRKASDEARAARDELQAARDALAKSAGLQTERRKSLEARVEDQRRLLASVQEQRAQHDEAVRELEQAARQLSDKLRSLSGKPPEQKGSGSKAEAQAQPARPIGPVVPFKQRRGKLLFPVAAGRVEVRFGRRVDPRFGTVTLQRGLDVRAPEGTDVLAVADGRVAYSGWFKGYGNLVIVDHGENYFSLMAHLGELHKAVGDEVRAGERVGAVGDTGSLKGAYLYFELREGQKPLDPDRWLTRKRPKARPQAAKPRQQAAAGP